MLLGVAPRKGAWIETRMRLRRIDTPRVAPRKGAWIETCAAVRDAIGSARRAPHGRVD